jgi:hypothetical protein
MTKNQETSIHVKKTILAATKLSAVFAFTTTLGFGCSAFVENTSKQNPSDQNASGGGTTQALGNSTNSKDALSPKLAISERLLRTVRVDASSHFRCEIDTMVGPEKPFFHKLDVPYGSRSNGVTVAYTWDKLGPEIWTKNYTSAVPSQCIAGERRGFTIVECKFRTGSLKSRENRIEISLDAAVVSQAFVRKAQINQAVWFVEGQAFATRCFMPEIDSASL